MVNKRNPTIKDVAKKAGVSHATVSRYINSSDYVDVDTAETIRKVIEEINYVPNKIARGLKTNKSKTIMLVVADIMNPYYSEMHRHVQWIAKEKDYSVLLFDTEEKIENEVSACEFAKSEGAEGIIFCSINESNIVFESLNKLHIPIVTNLTHLKGFDTIHDKTNVSTYITTKHLIDLGHKRIAYVGGAKDTWINMRRKKEFMSALEENNIAFDKDLSFEMDFTMDAGYKAGMYLKSLKEMPTAVCASIDLIAMGVMVAFYESGIRVPDDVSITGQGNVEFSKVSRPGLTTTSNNSSYFAETAAKMLFERIEGIYTGPPREVITSRELIIRESTKKLFD